LIGLAILVLAACGEEGGQSTCQTPWIARNSGTVNTLFGVGVFSGQSVAVGALGTIL